MDRISLDLLDYAEIKDMQLNIDIDGLITIDLSLVPVDKEFLDIITDYLTRNFDNTNIKG